MLRALAFSLSLCGLAAQGAAQTPSPGDVVARVELGAPAADSFVLHATVPVPRHTWPRDDDRTPFLLRGPDGSEASAQVEVVSRWPGQSDGADVVEVLGRVELPPGTIAGERVTWDVVWFPHRGDDFRAHPTVRALFSDENSIQLRATDVFGHVYVAYPLRALHEQPQPRRLRILRKGGAALQAATHDMLLPRDPSTGPQGTLPHLVGVHCYTTRWRDERFFSLDLRVHNAPSGLDAADPADDPVGRLYFRELEIVLPAGWTVMNTFGDPSFGPPQQEGPLVAWPIVDALPDGKLHVMPALGQFLRRLVVARVGEEQRARATLSDKNLAFCRPGTAPDGRELWSWWNPQTARYFPQRHVLPRLEHIGLRQLRDAHEDELALRSTQHAGTSPPTWPVVAGPLGWAHPWGTAGGGMPGGTEIWLWDGIETAAAASTAGYRLAQLVHQMYTSRQHNVLFDLPGLHTRFESWTQVVGGRTFLPVWWFNGPMFWAADPFGYSSTPSFQRDAVAALGLTPDYQTELLGYQPIDEEHLVRYTRSPKVLVWLGNDALARDDLRAQAEGIRFTFNALPQDLGGSVIPTGLLHAKIQAQEHPGQGLAYGRAEGWGLDVVCAAYSTLGPDWRASARPWFDAVIDVLETAQASCTDVIQATPMPQLFGGQYRCRQSIECAISEHALVGMRESVYAGVAPQRVQQVDSVLEGSLRAMVGPLVWSSDQHGPWSLFAVGPLDPGTPLFCSFIPQDGTYGTTDQYQVWSSFAYGYEISGDPLFLQKAEEMIGGPLLARLLAGGRDNLQNRAALLALLQLGG